MSLKPINDYILCVPYEEPAKGSLLIMTPKETEFRVLAVSDELTDIKCGDVILVNKFSGTDVEISNEKYRVFSIKQVIGVLNDL